MKNFVKLSKNEMKMVVGGTPSGLELIDNGGGSGGSNPKIDACKNLAYGASCSYALNNTSYTGTCQSYFAGPKFCSTLM